MEKAFAPMLQHKHNSLRLKVASALFIAGGGIALVVFFTLFVFSTMAHGFGEAMRVDPTRLIVIPAISFLLLLTGIRLANRERKAWPSAVSALAFALINLIVSPPGMVWPLLVTLLVGLGLTLSVREELE